MIKVCGGERPHNFKAAALPHRLIFSLLAPRLFFRSALNWDVQSKSEAKTLSHFISSQAEKLDISLCHLVTEQNSLILCAWRSNRFAFTWLSVFCKLLKKVDFLLLTDFFLAAIPSNSHIPPFVPGNLPSQNSVPEMQLKMTVIYLMSLHLGVPCPHLSKLSLFTMVPLETSRCHSEPQGFPFTLTSPPGTAEICGCRQPASPSVSVVSPWCQAPLRDAEHPSSLLLSPQLPFATCFCSAHTHRRKVLLSTFKHFIFSPDPHQPSPLGSITSALFFK